MKRWSNTLYVGAIIGLLLFLIVSLLPGDSAPETDADRAHRIASELRCPFCNGESIADAQSSIGADLRELISEQVASGMTDDEIVDYYVSVYSDRVLLSPPLLGWGALLWILPTLALIGGVFAMSRRRRGDSVVATVTDPRAVAEARRIVEADLAEVDVQVAVGELDAEVGSALKDAYQLERAQLEAIPPASDVNQQPRSRARALAGAAVLVLGAVALSVAVAATVRDRAPGDLITGGIASQDQGRDLSTVTNEEMEAVIAANPDVIPMRLALAGRYFDEGQFSKAVVHYMEVLQREQHPEALANVGWMTYLSGEVETGLSFVERALEVTTDLPQSYWYLANIRYWGLGDAAGAVAPLETLLTFDAIPTEVRDAAAELLVEVQEAL